MTIDMQQARGVGAGVELTTSSTVAVQCLRIDGACAVGHVSGTVDDNGWVSRLRVQRHSSGCMDQGQREWCEVWHQRPPWRWATATRQVLFGIVGWTGAWLWRWTSASTVVLVIQT